MDRGSYHSIGGGDQNNLKTKKDMQEFKVVVCEEFTNSCGKKIKGKEKRLKAAANTLQKYLPMRIYKRNSISRSINEN